MDGLRTLLIANRGEIAVRLIRTAKKLGIRNIAIYTAADAASSHVGAADEAILLEGPDSQAYLDGTQIIRIAKQHKADAIIPGYGFLSENTDFARQVVEEGMVFVGPSPKCIQDFGIKHTARELAHQADVPIVPGSPGLIDAEDDAVGEAHRLGFPVMLKATAGGGGMGLQICSNEHEVRESFNTVQSRGKTLFKNPGLFIEKYYPSSHHIEVQVFGNGRGNAIHFGERECSIQRRHQKVIEECPSPFVTNKYPELRDKLGAASIRLAESINYGSAGTIEYLVDDESGDFFFLEMNTRLQVEHGITELCYDIDLVELMLQQADAERKGEGGLTAERLAALQPPKPSGFAIEARVYAENPAKDYAPSPGVLQEVSWKEVKGARIDTWVHRGTKVTSHYDPLLAKVMIHAATRNEAVDHLQNVLRGSVICGPPTNIDFLAAILDDDRFRVGSTMTKFLETFRYRPAAIEVLKAGAYTLVEDWPGRPTIGRGFSHSGPMDEMAFRVANMLVGNAQGVAGIEITLSGPDLRFLGDAIIALTGAPMEAQIDGNSFPMWTRVKVTAGQRLTIGKTTGGGCRAYLAIFGGLPSIATWFGSKSTSPMTAVGGYQGRALAAGDFFAITADIPAVNGELSIPEHLRPEYPDQVNVFAMSGPYDKGFITDEFIDTMYASTWTVSHNASRGGIRLLGPRPQWARSDGGEGGSHPSNVIEYGYPLGTINWTGDDPCLFPIDAPDFGGFVSVLTVVKADFWRLGQIKAGNKLRVHRISYEDALLKRKELENLLDQIESVCKGEEDASQFGTIKTPKYDAYPSRTDLQTPAQTPAQTQTQTTAIVHQIPESPTQPLVSYRQGGDEFLLVDYGDGDFDLNHRCRAVALYKRLQEPTDEEEKKIASSIYVGMPCGNSLMLHFSSLQTPRPTLLSYLVRLETLLGDLSRSTFPSRKFCFPITFTSPVQRASLDRYMQTQRPYASYLPDPFAFVAKNNAITEQELRDIFTKSTLMVVAVGFFVALPIALPVDPRQRIQSPKMNPSRVQTPEGQVGWGGSCMSLYNVESPGGYMNTGLSIPGVDILGFKAGYTPERPWLFDDFDQITFREVDEKAYDLLLAEFRAGHYVYEYEKTVFDMAEHNRLLAATKDEVKVMKAKQKAAQAEMNRVEKEMLEKWNKERESTKVGRDEVEELLNDPDTTLLESPLTANVWKVTIEPDEPIDRVDQTLAILEAMKLEIPVKADESMVGTVVEKILVKPGEVVEAGAGLAVLRRRQQQQNDTNENDK